LNAHAMRADRWHIVCFVIAAAIAANAAPFAKHDLVPQAQEEDAWSSEHKELLHHTIDGITISYRPESHTESDAGSRTATLLDTEDTEDWSSWKESGDDDTEDATEHVEAPHGYAEDDEDDRSARKEVREVIGGSLSKDANKAADEEIRKLDKKIKQYGGDPGEMKTAKSKELDAKIAKQKYSTGVSLDAKEREKTEKAGIRSEEPIMWKADKHIEHKPEKAEESPGLSTTVIIIIVISSTLGVLLLALAAWYLTSGEATNPGKKTKDDKTGKKKKHKTKDGEHKHKKKGAAEASAAAEPAAPAKPAGANP